MVMWGTFQSHVKGVFCSRVDGSLGIVKESGLVLTVKSATRVQTLELFGKMRRHGDNQPPNVPTLFMSERQTSHQIDPLHPTRMTNDRALLKK